MRHIVFAAIFCLLVFCPLTFGSTGTDELTVLPEGTDLNGDSTTNPREVFHSEAVRGRRSYQVNLGNLAFNSPYVLGATAQKAHMSCGTCHVNGASNSRLFIPGLSTRPGTFDTTSHVFNPKADNSVLDPVTIPSLRGARYQAPYGHDGRTGSLRDFVHNVIVNEFAGPEPSAQILDAIVAYINDIDFLPNPNLDGSGHLQAAANQSARRGEALFSRPFPHKRNLSCATCHVPSAAFVDHQAHDVGTGGLFKTPTLLNADFNGPYFHDGRFDNFQQVIDHFNRLFDLRLTRSQKADLASYLTAVGNGVLPEYQLAGINVLEDESGFASVLDLAIAQHDREVIDLATRTVGEQLKDLAQRYPDSMEFRGPDPIELSRGLAERRLARATVEHLAQTLDAIATDANAGEFAAAAARYLSYRRLTVAAAPRALEMAEPWSAFNPTLRAKLPRAF
jgi:hypothetical protein